MIFTDTFISELAVPPDLGVTYSPATIELATGHRFGSAWTGIDSVAWHGDPRMYVDVFDVPLARFRPGSVGAEFGHFVRYEYRPTTSIVGFSDAVVYGDLRTDGVVSLDPQFQQDQFFGPWQTVRVYDRGECSAGENWRPILQAIAEGLDERILGALGQEGLDPAVLGNATLDPILRDSFAVVENTNDAFRIRRAYAFDTDLGPHGAECGGVLRIRFRGRFAGRDWRLVYILESVESVSVEIGEPCAGAGVGTTLEDTVRGVLESELESGITEQTSRRASRSRVRSCGVGRIASVTISWPDSSETSAPTCSLAGPGAGRCPRSSSSCRETRSASRTSATSSRTSTASTSAPRASRSCSPTSRVTRGSLSSRARTPPCVTDPYPHAPPTAVSSGRSSIPSSRSAGASSETTCEAMAGGALVRGARRVCGQPWAAP